MPVDANNLNLNYDNLIQLSIHDIQAAKILEIVAAKDVNQAINIRYLIGLKALNQYRHQWYQHIPLIGTKATTTIANVNNSLDQWSILINNDMVQLLNRLPPQISHQLETYINQQPLMGQFDKRTNLPITTLDLNSNSNDLNQTTPAFYINHLYNILASIPNTIFDINQMLNQLSSHKIIKLLNLLNVNSPLEFKDTNNLYYELCAMQQAKNIMVQPSNRILKKCQAQTQVAIENRPINQLILNIEVLITMGYQYLTTWYEQHQSNPTQTEFKMLLTGHHLLPQ